MKPSTIRDANTKRITARPKVMAGSVASDELIGRYAAMFVNRRAYTIQSLAPDPEKRRCFYYRPKGRVELSTVTLRRHLAGEITIGLYAINPATQRSKWVAIDADYQNALEDLLHLQWELRQDGIDAALERSRRGGHLWIFALTPLAARDCRLYIHHLAARLRVPVKGTGLAEGIEVFPRQDTLRAGEFGNAIRAPLGVHLADGRRYWFYGADYHVAAQMDYLSRIKRITQEEMRRFVAGLETPAPPAPTAKQTPPLRGFPGSGRPEFRILDHVTPKRRVGRNYLTRCPACAQEGRDRTGDNLSVSIADPRFYKCWAGCAKEQIRAALGCPIPQQMK